MDSDSSTRLVLLNRLAEEFATRYRLGERPALEEYVERYPDLADDIREFFPAMAEMEQVREDRQRVLGEPATGPLPPLERLGDFRILREIGRGGMGVVYEAEQVSLGRHVALKILPQKLLVDVRTRRRETFSIAVHRIVYRAGHFGRRPWAPEPLTPPPLAPAPTIGGERRTVRADGARMRKSRRRFEREAKAAARLHHTNIVPVFGVGEHDGLPYYVMQFIQGLGLNEVLKELKRLQAGARGSGSTPRWTDVVRHVVRPDVSAADIARSLLSGQLGSAVKLEPPPSEQKSTAELAPKAAEDNAPFSGPPVTGPLVDPLSPSSSAVLPGTARRPGERQATYWQSVARIGVQVAEALEYAHQQGITHRDIKPSNLLLDARGTVWVTDFGLAKADDQPNLTDAGDLLGTLRYMPPEAFEGQVDARGNVYSLGMTLYELLALRPAFGANDRKHIIKQVTTTEPAPLDRLNPAVPRDLVTIVHKAIGKEPGRRYPTATALAADLQRFVEDRPIQARPIGPAERTWRWCRRNPLVAALTAAVAILLIAGTTVATSFAIDATLARHRADAEARKAQRNADEARESARKEADEHRRADQEAAAWANLYTVRLNAVQMAMDSTNVGLARDLLEQVRQPRPGQREFPGWEWHYYWRLSHNELRPIQGRSDYLAGVAFSPDGTRIAYADDMTLRVWDTATDRPVASRGIRSSWIPCLAYSPDGTHLAVAAGDGAVRILDAGRLQELLLIKAHTQVVRGLAFAPDGDQLVTASEDGTLKLWRVASGREVRTFRGHIDRVQGVALSPDGRLLASAGEDGTVRLWELASGRPVRTLQTHGAGVIGVTFSPDGLWLASAGKDRAVRVWDVASGREIRTLTGHTDDARCVAFSPDGTRLASAGNDQMVKVWDVGRGQEVTNFFGHAGGVYGLAFSPDGRWLASAGSDRQIRFWDLGRRPGPQIYRGHDDQVRGVAFSPDGRWLTSVGLDGRIVVRDVVTGQEQPRFPTAGARWLALAHSPDSRLLATAAEAGTVVVWDARTGRQLWGLPGHTSWVSSLAFSADGSILASGGNDRTIKLWDAATGRELQTLGGHRDEIKGLVFTRDGERLISGSNDRTLMVWDTATGQRIQTLNGHARGVTDVALSPDGRRLASASHDRTVKIWDLATGRELRTLKGHHDSVWSLAFSPDGARLATAGWDQTLRIWDLTTGFELATLKGHTDRVLGLAFSPDGGLLASAGGKDGTVRVWDGRPLTPATQTEREALGLLSFLSSRPLPRADVLRYVQDTGSVRPPVRALAQALADRYAEESDPAKYYLAAWPVIRHPYANVFVCRFALAQMNAACERAPDDRTFRLGLGVAQYRLGRFQKECYREARATLTRCDRKQPLALAFLAMTQYQLGNEEQARATRARLREAMKQPQWAGNNETLAVVHEAETLLAGLQAASN